MMERPEIKRLYKYLPFNVLTASTLVTRKIWYPFPSAFNDPFDCQIVSNLQNIFAETRVLNNQLGKLNKIIRTNDSNENSINHILAKMQIKNLAPKANHKNNIAQKQLEFERSLQEAIYNFGILSLTEDPKNIVMWSHYAAQHSGICLEFERSSENNLGINAKPVTYSLMRGSEAHAKNQSNLFFMKYSGWCYEREWRILENEGGKTYPFPGKLISVICGARMEDRDIEAIFGIIKATNADLNERVSIRYAKMSSKHYSLSLTKHGQKFNYL